MHTIAMLTMFLQQQCNVKRPKNLTPGRDSNQGFSVLEADAMTTLPRRHVNMTLLLIRFQIEPLKKIEFSAGTKNFVGPRSCLRRTRLFPGKKARCIKPCKFYMLVLLLFILLFYLQLFSFFEVGIAAFLGCP
jgi:hypothetical protein